MFGLGVFMMFYAFWVFWAPNALGDPDNYIPANPLSTPEHIVPEWYFLPFYAILRSIPDKLTGVIAMGASILILFVLPWLDRSPVRSGTYRPAFKWFFWILVFVCVILMFCGKYAPESYWMPFELRDRRCRHLHRARPRRPRDLAMSGAERCRRHVGRQFGQRPFGIKIIRLGQLATIYYFAYFLVILPLLSIFERRCRCRCRSASRCWAAAGDGSAPLPSRWRRPDVRASHPSRLVTLLAGLVALLDRRCAESGRA